MAGAQLVPQKGALDKAASPREAVIMEAAAIIAMGREAIITEIAATVAMGRKAIITETAATMATREATMVNGGGDNAESRNYDSRGGYRYDNRYVTTTVGDLFLHDAWI